MSAALRSVRSDKPSGSVVRSGPIVHSVSGQKPSGFSLNTKPNAQANRVYAASTTIAVTYNESGITYNQALMTYNDSSFVVLGSGGDRGPHIISINYNL